MFVLGPSQPSWSLRSYSPKCQKIPTASPTHLLLLIIPNLTSGFKGRCPGVSGSASQRQRFEPRQGCSSNSGPGFRSFFSSGSQRRSSNVHRKGPIYPCGNRWICMIFPMYTHIFSICSCTVLFFYEKHGEASENKTK